MSGRARVAVRAVLIAAAALALAAVLGVPLLTRGAGAAPRAPARASTEVPPPADPHLRIATFSGGCFWCMEPPFDAVDGVISTTSGYTGGRTPNPTYEEVSSGATGHAESIRIVYDPARVTYQKLLDVFWHNIDPVAKDRQFCDSGSQYRSAIWYHDEEQKRLAEASLAALQASGRFHEPIATRIEPAGPFYAAEKYHQDYYRKNPVRYKFYRYTCGRDRRLEEIWGASPR